MKLKILAAILAVTAISACSTVRYNYAPETSSFSIPALNLAARAGLGEPLLDQGVRIKRDTLSVTSPATISFYKIAPGKFLKVGESETHEYFNQDIASGASISGGLVLTMPYPGASLIRTKDSGKICISRPTDIDVCGNINHRLEKEFVLATGSFRRTLIYSGRVDNKLKISYREFNNDMARSAFSTDVEYDLNESSVIGYAGARIEILSATNTEIRYKVLSNFNKAAF